MLSQLQWISGPRLDSATGDSAGLKTLIELERVEAEGTPLQNRGEEERERRRRNSCSGEQSRAGVQQIYDVLSTLTAGGSSTELSLLLVIVSMDACIVARSGWLVSRYP